MDKNKKLTTDLGRLSAPPVPDFTEKELKQLFNCFERVGFMKKKPDRNSRLDLLCEIFQRDGRVEIKETQALFDPLPVDLLIEKGLLQKIGDKIRGLFLAQSYDGLLIFSDYTWEEKSGDYVLQVGPSGRYLAAITVRKPAQSALDLGCGCGIQSLLLAGHTKHVTATDINPRALTMTRFNARLNGFDNIETLEGSYLEPVQNQTFDLIVANTPYVITPKLTQVYRDVSEPGDAVVLRLLKQIPNHLNDNGFAHILINWVHKKHEDPSTPIRQIVKKSKVDTLLIHGSSNTPAEYAYIWIYDDIKRNPIKFIFTFVQWFIWYKKMGIERIAFGGVCLRHREEAREWFHVIKTSRVAGRFAGKHVENLFSAQDNLAGESSTRAFDEMKLIPAHLDIQTGTEGEITRIKLRNALLLKTSISSLTGETLKYLDGTRNVQQAIEMTCVNKDEIFQTKSQIHTLLELGYMMSTQ